MKINITISLDKELVERLKEENNYSDLINREVKAYYDGVEAYNIKKLKKKRVETKQILKEKRKELKEINKKIEKVETKEARILKITKKYPSYVFKIMEGCDTQAKFWTIFRDDKILRRYKWLELKKLFNNLKGGGGL
jgi:hypothetical protein